MDSAKRLHYKIQKIAHYQEMMHIMNCLQPKQHNSLQNNSPTQMVTKAQSFQCYFENMHLLMETRNMVIRKK